MKKNYVMRTASIVLALVLATACLVSGTFAKYITTMYGTDTARVAYFEFGSDVLGETQDATINLWDTVIDEQVRTLYTSDGFGLNLPYADKNEGEDGKKIIAPGTRGVVDMQLWGKAEVDAYVDFDFTLTTGADIPLVFRALGEDNEYHYFSNYYAAGDVVKVCYDELIQEIFDSKLEATAEESFINITIEGTLADMGNFMSFLYRATDMSLPQGDPVKPIDNYEFDSIEWCWPYEEVIDGTLDERDTADTTLGKDAIYATGNIDNPYIINNIPAKFDIKVTITQVD